MKKHASKEKEAFDEATPWGTVVTMPWGWSMDWSRVLKGPYSVQTLPVSLNFSINMTHPTDDSCF